MVKIDFCITDDGELRFDTDSKDIELVKKDSLNRQKIVTVLKSALRDWYNSPKFGANLEEFIGESSSDSTVNAIIDRVTNCVVATTGITKDELFFIPKIKNNIFEAVLFIKKEDLQESYEMNIVLDLAGEVKVV